jgi:hypothetical protein
MCECLRVCGVCVSVSVCESVCVWHCVFYLGCATPQQAFHLHLHITQPRTNPGKALALSTSKFSITENNSGASEIKPGANDHVFRPNK